MRSGAARSRTLAGGPAPHLAALWRAGEELAGTGSWHWDPNSGAYGWSPGLARLLGPPAPSATTAIALFLDHVHLDDRSRIAAVIEQAIDGRGPLRERFRTLVDGRRLEGLWTTSQAAPGDVWVIGVVHDVTERGRLDRTSRLLQITDTALSAMPLDDLLVAVLARVCQGLPAQAAALLLCEPPDALVLRATHGLGEDFDTTRLSTGRGLAARVIDADATVVLSSDAIRHVQVTALRTMGAVAGVPLRVANEIIGVLEVGRRDPDPFSPEDLGLLELAADRTAMSLDHARAFERERHIAATLQRSLLPERVPDIPGIDVEIRFLPVGQGQHIGGDFYDVIEIGDRRWLLVLGDVCGKGVVAAARTGMARYTLRAEALHEPRPGELLGLLNDAMLAQASDLTFCTAVCIVLDQTGPVPTVTTAVGGHPMPLIIHQDGTVEQAARQSGPLIGVWDNAHFPAFSYVLDPGDTLVMYTDGLLEANAPQQILAPEDLATVAAGLATRPLASFVRALENIAVGTDVASNRDDIAILACAVRGPVDDLERIAHRSDNA